MLRTHYAFVKRNILRCEKFSSHTVKKKKLRNDYTIAFLSFVCVCVCVFIFVQIEMHSIGHGGDLVVINMAITRRSTTRHIFVGTTSKKDFARD